MTTPDSSAAITCSRRPTCRFCEATLVETFVDLGTSPLCQTQIAPGHLDDMEPFFPLHVYVCSRCFLVQLRKYVAPDVIFAEDYPYFSSYSDSWVAHAERYVAHMIADFDVGQGDFVVEIASNDGYLLQHFVRRKIRCLGIEPAAGVAKAAAERNVPTICKFFGTITAQDLRIEYGPAQLILGNNVLAHVPDVNDFVRGVCALLDAGGIATFEFPHLMRLVDLNQFDTIYHEHFSYFSFNVVIEIFEAHGLRVFDVLELDTHGGSLRIYACHADDERPTGQRVVELSQRELALGYRDLRLYSDFTRKVEGTKRQILKFLIEAKEKQKQVVGYGAPGKGNTLLNYCGIRTDFLDYTVDRNPHKQNTYTPGTRIPIHEPSRIFETKPDYVFILPWNLTDEIVGKMLGIRDWGGRFVVPIPEVRIID